MDKQIGEGVVLNVKMARREPCLSHSHENDRIRRLENFNIEVNNTNNQNKEYIWENQTKVKENTQKLENAVSANTIK